MKSIKSMPEFIKSNIFISKVDVSQRFRACNVKKLKNTVKVKDRILVSAVALNLLNGTVNSGIVQNARAD